MSRNLGQNYCCYCPATPKLDEPPRPITEEEAGVYFDEYEGMLVANATCSRCEAKYLAWVDQRTMVRGHAWPRSADAHVPFVDLSFRSTFNDEPGVEDLPTAMRLAKEIPEVVQRVLYYATNGMWTVRDRTELPLGFMRDFEDHAFSWMDPSR